MTASSDLEEAFAFQLRALQLPAPERQYRAVPPRRFKWDFAWPASALLVEVDGIYVAGGRRCFKCGQQDMGRHARREGIEQDAEKQSTAAAAGWRTMRVTPGLIESGRAAELVEAALRRPAFTVAQVPQGAHDGH